MDQLSVWCRRFDQGREPPLSHQLPVATDRLLASRLTNVAVGATAGPPPKGRRHLGDGRFQLHPEHATLANNTIHANAPAHQFHQALAQCQADAGALDRAGLLA
jgi:hypothetical protein